MTFHEFKNGMTVMDGRRCVAKARVVPHKGWLLRMYGGCWMDPAARKPTVRGHVNPTLWLVNRRSKARTILNQLAKGAMS